MASVKCTSYTVAIQANTWVQRLHVIPNLWQTAVDSLIKVQL